MNIKFTFLVTTLNRSHLLCECLNSLVSQIYSNFEIIIIDQSDDTDTQRVVELFREKYKSIYIKYIFSNVKKLSNARNIGIEASTGDFICIVDDDAKYDENYIHNAIVLIMKYNPSVLSGKIIDDEQDKYFVDYMNLYKTFLNFELINKVCLSASLIISKKVFEDVGYFDEDFGIGASFGSAEETDLLVRAFLNKHSVYFSDDLRVYHKLESRQYTDLEILKAFNYAVGAGALLKKHWNANKVYFTIRSLRLTIGPLIRCLMSLNDKRIIKYQYCRFKGHIHGMIYYK